MPSTKDMLCRDEYSDNFSEMQIDGMKWTQFCLDLNGELYRHQESFESDCACTCAWPRRVSSGKGGGFTGLMKVRAK